MVMVDMNADGITKVSVMAVLTHGNITGLFGGLLQTFPADANREADSGQSVIHVQPCPPSASSRDPIHPVRDPSLTLSAFDHCNYMETRVYQHTARALQM